MYSFGLQPGKAAVEIIQVTFQAEPSNTVP